MKQPLSNLLLCSFFILFFATVYWFHHQGDSATVWPEGVGMASAQAAGATPGGYDGQAEPAGEQVLSPDLLGFDYKITSEVINEQQQVLASSVFSGKLALKSLADNHRGPLAGAEADSWLGQILEGSLEQQGEGQQFQQPVLFTTRYRDFVFSDTDMLGLDAGHPAHAVVYLLSQLSYDLKQPLTFAVANGRARYRYFHQDRQLSRELESRTSLTGELQQELALSVEKITENWQLTLDDQALPGKLRHVLNTFYHNRQGGFVVRQKIEVGALDKSALEQTGNWQQSAYTAGANSALDYPGGGLESEILIASEQELLQALAKLAALPDEDLAKAIGKYLMEHYSATELIALINGQDNADKLASLVIYSLEKNPEFAAEVMLVDLLEHPEVNSLNKQRVVMSLGRFMAVSEYSLGRLQQLAQTSNNTLANTARLSIGSVARFNEQQQGEVSRFLSGQLAQGREKAVTLLAINNSGLDSLNEQAAQYLGDASPAVNVALIKLLAKDPAYHDRLINFAITSNQAKTIQALAKALAANRLSLDERQRQQVVAQIDRASAQVVKDQLSGLLTAQEKSW